jgi:hypothetical protein
MKRRDFVGKLGIGSAALLSGGALGKGLGAAPAAVGQEGGHDHTQVTGTRASATVSFGQWLVPAGAPEVSRFPNLNPRQANQHLLIPYVARIKAGGSVNFIVAGFHHILVYAPGTQTTDINTTLTVPATNNPPPPANPLPRLINDPTNRVYRGLDPSTQPTQDRVEVVSFKEPGKYLVICGVLPHFVNDNMHGFVTVVDGDEDDG